MNKSLSENQTYCDHLILLAKGLQAQVGLLATTLTTEGAATKCFLPLSWEVMSDGSVIINLGKEANEVADRRRDLEP